MDYYTILYTVRNHAEFKIPLSLIFFSKHKHNIIFNYI